MRYNGQRYAFKGHTYGTGKRYRAALIFDNGWKLIFLKYVHIFSKIEINFEALFVLFGLYFTNFTTTFTTGIY